MFTLITGAPGSGKSLILMDTLKNGVLFPDSDQIRPVFYYGIPEVSPDLGWTLLDDPKNWQNEVEDGSIVVIDEVQEHYPVRPAKNPVPDGLKAIEKHRHRGLDLYFLTQHPSLLDHHPRRLVNEHWHLKRNMGAPFAVVYRSTETMDNPKDYHTLKSAEKITFKYPKDTFKLYKSAEVHTHKFRIPKVFYLLIFLILFIFSMIYVFYDTLFSDSKQTNNEATTHQETQTNPFGSQNKQSNITTNSFIPSIDNTPASSPFYSNNWKPKSVPIISSCIGTPDRCSCYTQQGTKVSVTNEFCISVLKNGSLFDHTLNDNRKQNKQNEYDKQ